jgi:quercetin dioxygenase-like cupin family protein
MKSGGSLVMVCVGPGLPRQQTGITGKPERFRNVPTTSQEFAMSHSIPASPRSPVFPDRCLTLLTDAVTVRTDTEETAGAYALYEYITPPGGGFPPHTHRYDDITLVVVDGTYTVLAGERTAMLTRGEALLVPKGTVLGYVNPGTEPARLLAIVAPGRIHEQFLADAGDCAGRPAWEADMARILAIAPKYGIEFETSQAQ